MAFTSWLMRLLTKTVWPWFVAHIWPRLQEHVVKAVLEAILAFSRRLEALIVASWRQRAREAAERAEAADDSATAAVDPAEAQAHRSEAAAWRLVAEQSLASYEELAGRVRALEEELLRAVQKSVMDVEPKLDMDPLGLNLTIDEFTTRLPELVPLKSGYEASTSAPPGRSLEPSTAATPKSHAQLPESGEDE